jgi:hypothetical protein
VDTFYILTDIDSGNVVSDYETKAAALTAIRALHDGYGPDAVQNLLLTRSDGSGFETFVASQEVLVQLALGMVTVQS